MFLSAGAREQFTCTGPDTVRLVLFAVDQVFGRTGENVENGAKVALSSPFVRMASSRLLKSTFLLDVLTRETSSGSMS